MPHLFAFAGHGHNDDHHALDPAQQETGEESPPKRPRRSSMLRNMTFGGLRKRHHESESNGTKDSATSSPPLLPFVPLRSPSLPGGTDNRRAIPSLPRPQTFRRQESEKREKLLVVPPSPTERRASSVDRRQRGLSASAVRRPPSPKPVPFPSISAPDIRQSQEQITSILGDTDPGDPLLPRPPRSLPELPPLQIPDPCIIENNDEDDEGEVDLGALQEEYDRRWILNLSMHFRDKSNREKFFVTYAETPTNWRRLTISLDYRNAPEESLEADMSSLHYQRDKSFRIYEAIHESLPDIQYYKTVTNLKLETTPEDGQLHVHVREDANEIIQYPTASLFEHVHVRRFAESEVEFITHLSGFVYKVRVDGNVVIKKEIPGPDTVDEFLYEVNALHALLGASNVVQLEGLVLDESRQVVKGLLIAYAAKGALIDMLYDLRNTPELPWHRREKWAKQIVSGLSDIHEAGFVQGDFTLSNIVIDDADNAQIIDINRRGCPVGWEPPELGLLIDSGQRIGMCIGVKTDLFQLGMVLWALAEEVDEPERVARPLKFDVDDIPTYFQNIVGSCLSSRPQTRPSALRLLRKFPPSAGFPPSPICRPTTVDFVSLSPPRHPLTNSLTSHRSDKEYIDPKMAITLEDVNPPYTHHPDRRRRDTDTSLFTSGQVTYVDPDSQPASTSYKVGSSGSWIDCCDARGRSPVSSRRRGRTEGSPFARAGGSESSATSRSRSPPPSRSRPRRGESESVGRSGEDDCKDAAEREHFVKEGWEEGDGEVVEAEGSGDEEGKTGLQGGARRIAGLKDEVLMHQDSGFDELMVEELNSLSSESVVAQRPANEEKAAEPVAVPGVRTEEADPSTTTHIATAVE